MPPYRQDLSTARNGTVQGANGGRQQLGSAAMRRLGQQQGAGGAGAGSPGMGAKPVQPGQPTPNQGYPDPSAGSGAGFQAPIGRYMPDSVALPPPGPDGIYRPGGAGDVGGVGAGWAGGGTGIDPSSGLLGQMNPGNVGSIQTAISSLRNQLGMPTQPGQPQPGQDPSQFMGAVQNARGRLSDMLPGQGYGQAVSRLPATLPFQPSGAGSAPSSPVGSAPGASMPTRPGAARPNPNRPGGPFQNAPGTTPGTIPGGPGMGTKPGGLSPELPPSLPPAPGGPQAPGFGNSEQQNPYAALLSRIRNGGGSGQSRGNWV